MNPIQAIPSYAKPTVIISMAAVFERGPGVYGQQINANEIYSNRREPLTYAMRSTVFDFDVLQPIMNSVTSDWLYGALDHIMLQTPAPQWSRDGWAFTPVDLSMLPNITIRANSGNIKDHSNEFELLPSSSNASLTTSALRARLQCETIPTLDDSWYNKSSSNDIGYKNITRRLNMTGYLLPGTIYDGKPYGTSLFANPGRIYCCSNQTDDKGRSAVGYWSVVQPEQWFGGTELTGGKDRNPWTKPGPDQWPGNFTIKWIVGPTVQTHMSIWINNAPSSYKLMQFTEIPALSFLHCQPIVEEATAKLTIGRASGEVLEYKVLDTPKPAADAWKAHFGRINHDGSVVKYNRTISGMGSKIPENYTAGVRYVENHVRKFQTRKLTV